MEGLSASILLLISATICSGLSIPDASTQLKKCSVDKACVEKVINCINDESACSSELENRVKFAVDSEFVDTSIIAFFSTVREHYALQFVKVEDKLAYLNLRGSIPAPVKEIINEDIPVNQEAVRACAEDKECATEVVLCLIEKNDCKTKIGKAIYDVIEKANAEGEICQSCSESDRKLWKDSSIAFVEVIMTHYPYQWIAVEDKFGFLNLDLELPEVVAEAGVSEALPKGEIIEVCEKDEKCVADVVLCIIEKNHCKTNVGKTIYEMIDESSAAGSVCPSCSESTRQKWEEKLVSFFSYVREHFPFEWIALEGKLSFLDLKKPLPAIVSDTVESNSEIKTETVLACTESTECVIEIALCVIDSNDCVTEMGRSIHDRVAAVNKQGYSNTDEAVKIYCNNCSDEEASLVKKNFQLFVSKVKEDHKDIYENIKNLVAFIGV